MLYDARKQKRKFRLTFYIILFFQKNWKILLKVLLVLSIFSIIFLPTLSGNIIGNWIKDFFGTIINILKTI